MSVAGHRKKTVYTVDGRHELMFLPSYHCNNWNERGEFFLRAPRFQPPELSAQAAWRGSLCSAALLSHCSSTGRYCLPARHMVRLIYFHKLFPQVFGARFSLLIECVHVCPYLFVQEENYQHELHFWSVVCNCSWPTSAECIQCT